MDAIKRHSYKNLLLLNSFENFIVEQVYCFARQQANAEPYGFAICYSSDQSGEFRTSKKIF
jgi:hypothetical protein